MKLNRIIVGDTKWVILGMGIIMALAVAIPADGGSILPPSTLSVSIINSTINRYMSGPTVIEVVVNDSNINDIFKKKGEPDVTINGKILRMVQAIDGKWYGYFADVNTAQIADSTTTVVGEGLDFGIFCDNTQNLGVAPSTVTVSDTVGIAVPGTSSGGIQGSSTGGVITTGVCIFHASDNMNVIREPKDVNTNVPSKDGVGQIGIDANVWPFIQLYSFNSTGNVVVQYNKGGGVEKATISIEPIREFIARMDEFTSGDGKKFELQLDSGSFTPLIGFQIENIIGNKTKTDNFFFLQTTHYLDLNERKKLEEQGITLVDFFNHFVYVASANDTSLDTFPVNSHPEIRSMIPIEPDTKLDSNIKSRDVPPWVFKKSVKDFKTGLHIDKIGITVFFHKQLHDKEMTKIITSYNGEIGSVMEGISAVSALMSFDQITELSKHSAIKFIRYQDPPLEPEISEAKRVGNINQIKSEYNLTGKGSVALIFDGGFVSSHDDFNGRLYRISTPDNLYISSDSDRGHSTLVAGILGGDGSVDSNYKGVAPNVQILSWGTRYNTDQNPRLWGDDNGDLVEAFENANSILNTHPSDDPTITIGDRIDVMNISLGHEVGKYEQIKCNYLGNYTTTSHILDRFVNGYHAINNNQKYSEIIITQAAGNERILNNHCDDYIKKYEGFSTVNSPATAKNPIVVGSIDSNFDVNERYVVSSFSSFGPTDDGRIKPDLVAPGAHNSNPMEDITSTGPNNNYIPSHGTSMAAPLVGGLVALMEEGWEIRYPTFHLLPHTAKAILIHTADDLGNPGPDYKYGWGLVNGKNAIKLIEDSITYDGSSISDHPIIINDSFSASNSEKKYSLNLDNPTDLKLTLVWDDRGSPPGDFKSEVLLENNLDLLISKGTDKKMPLVLDKNIPDALAKEGTDTINNVEMIKSKLDKGVWTITVKGTGPFLKETDFTLIVSKIKPIIPSWIKNDAGWWTGDKITDNDFVYGIQYLINMGIMEIPSTPQGTDTEVNKIPSWIKNDAGRWANGSIDDNSFVKGIQFLINMGKIKIQ